MGKKGIRKPFRVFKGKKFKASGTGGKEFLRKEGRNLKKGSGSWKYRVVPTSTAHRLYTKRG